MKRKHASAVEHPTGEECRVGRVGEPARDARDAKAHHLAGARGIRTPRSHETVSHTAGIFFIKGTQPLGLTVAKQ